MSVWDRYRANSRSLSSLEPIWETGSGLSDSGSGSEDEDGEEEEHQCGEGCDCHLVGSEHSGIGLK